MDWFPAADADADAEAVGNSTPNLSNTDRLATVYLHA